MNHQKAVDLKNLIDSQNANYHDLHQFSISIGEILAEVFKENLKNEILPNNRMYYNIAKKVIEPMLVNNYMIVAENAEIVQESLNFASGYMIKGQRPEVNQDRIDGIIQRLADEPDFEKVSWILDEPVVNFTQSVVDDAIETNAEFHHGSGLEPKIIRTALPDCCEWCSNLVGEYSYPNGLPRDIFKRHRYCRCEAEFKPYDFRGVQNVHTKQWQ